MAAFFGANYSGSAPEVTADVDNAPMDASDLGGYAGTLFDHYTNDDQVLRIAVCAAL